MSVIRMDGPFRLMVDEVRAALGMQLSGVYALGAMRGDGLFAVSSVGGSYSALDVDLCNRIGTAPSFKFSAISDPDVIFLRHCELFHTFQANGCVMHPERPRGSKLKCPVCHRAVLELQSSAMRR